MDRFFVITMPRRSTAIPNVWEADIFLAANQMAATTKLDAARRFPTAADALEERAKLNSRWQCHAQVREVRIIPATAARLEML